MLVKNSEGVYEVQSEFGLDWIFVTVVPEKDETETSFEFEFWEEGVGNELNWFAKIHHRTIQ